MLKIIYFKNGVVTHAKNNILCHTVSTATSSISGLIIFSTIDRSGGLKKLAYFRTCPVCAHSSLVPFQKATFDISNLDTDRIKITDSDYGKSWDLSQCTYCTHIFANPSPTPEFIQSLYSGTKDPLYQEEVKGRSKNFTRILSTLENIQRSKGILFDVGAATGILLDTARNRGWKVEGIEPSAWAARIARDKYNLEVHKGFFEDSALPEGRFAAVTMVDFIEHTPHPVTAAVKAHKILSPGGILCVVTPDIKSLAARVMGRKWWHLRPAHLAFFTKKSLDFLLQRVGFRMVKHKRYSWTFSVHYLLSRRPWLKRLLKNPALSSLSKKILIKLALQDSFEIYAKKAHLE